VPVKYALDSNLFIDAFRSDEELARLLEFHRRFAPWEYLSAVVALELRTGARSASAASRLQRHVLAAFENRGRVFAPGYAAWKVAGRALAELSQETTRAFCNDVLIAASCREHGITLITRNARDFERIREVLDFEFLAEWP
jgi:predicted nucleic acid-binding protein